MPRGMGLRAEGAILGAWRREVLDMCHGHDLVWDFSISEKKGMWRGRVGERGGVELTISELEVHPPMGTPINDTGW